MNNVNICEIDYCFSLCEYKTPFDKRTKEYKKLDAFVKIATNYKTSDYGIYIHLSFKHFEYFNNPILN